VDSLKELLGSLELNRVYQFDCVEGMKLLPDGTDEIGVDLIVTSPPYDDLRKYKGYSFDFENVAKQLYRIIKNGGVLVWVVNDTTIKGSETGTSFKQALYFKEIGFNLHDTMIYLKSNPMPINSPRYNQIFEYMFVLSKGKPKTVNLIKEPSKRFGELNASTHRQQDGSMKDATSRGKPINKMKVKGNVWTYAVGLGGTTNDRFAFEHPAMFPEKLAQDHILSWSNEGDIVFDPFIGSGTVAKMATLNNRKWLGFEISPEYIEIVNKRLDNLEQNN
jgi:site-specific DNA-methyltransferase (adenine-specific)